MTCFSSFLWDGKRHKIKRSEMIADYGDGGQKMLYIMAFNRYISDDCKSKCKSFFDFHFSKWRGKFVFLRNLEKKDVTKLDIKDEFLRELVRIWVDFNYRDSFHSTQDFVNSVIWNN